MSPQQFRAQVQYHEATGDSLEERVEFLRRNEWSWEDIAHNVAVNTADAVKVSRETLRRWYSTTKDAA